MVRSALLASSEPSLAGVVVRWEVRSKRRDFLTRTSRLCSPLQSTVLYIVRIDEILRIRPFHRRNNRIVRWLPWTNSSLDDDSSSVNSSDQASPRSALYIRRIPNVPSTHLR